LLKRYDYKCLLVIHRLYQQQRHMHTTRTHSLEDRTVNIAQPHGIRGLDQTSTSSQK
jgi:hypothetical protein